MLNRFVVADPGRCLGCYTCVAACAVVHNELGLQPFPRVFVVHTSEGTMPTQCRHCEDAPCARVCPVKAIEIKDQMVYLNEAICIGCKMCALACPFGCIEIRGTLPPSVEQAVPLGLDIDPLLSSGVGQKAVGIKCDLCVLDVKGPACIRSCPTKALDLVEGEEIEKLSKLKRSANVASAVSILRDGRQG